MNQILSPTRLSEVYRMAFELYRDGQYREALPLFRFLVIGDQTDVKYWKGLGACLQMIHEPEEALVCYRAALFHQNKGMDLTLFLHAADCSFELHQTTQGLAFLNSAEPLAMKTEDRRILEHIKLMKLLWKETTTI